MYTITIQGQNACGSDSSAQTFEVLSAPLADAQLDTNFACIPGAYTLNVSNLSTGDDLSYNFAASPSSTISDSSAPAPQITLTQTGWHTVTLEARNSACPADHWADSISISTAPAFTLEEVANSCVGSPIQLGVTYDNQPLLPTNRSMLEKVSALRINALYCSIPSFQVWYLTVEDHGLLNRLLKIHHIFLVLLSVWMLV